MRPTDRFIILDTETTGGSAQDRVIELGMIAIEQGRLTGERFASRFRAPRPIHWAATRVHGIRDRDLAGQPPFEQASDRVLDFIGGAPVWAHNAAFDARMMAHEWRLCGAPASRLPAFFCTMGLAAACGSSKLALDDLIREHLPHRSSRGKHSAIEDADLLACVLLRMMETSPSEAERFLRAARPVSASPGRVRDEKLRPVPALKRPSAPLRSGPAPLNPGVAEAIAHANRTGSVDLAVSLRTGRDAVTAMSVAELLSRTPRANALLAQRMEVPRSRTAALRMMVRGLDAHLAIAREERLALAYPDRGTPLP